METLSVAVVGVSPCVDIRIGDLVSLLTGLELPFWDVVELALLSGPWNDPMLSNEDSEYLLFSPSEFISPEVLAGADVDAVFARRLLELSGLSMPFRQGFCTTQKMNHAITELLIWLCQ